MKNNILKVALSLLFCLIPISITLMTKNPSVFYLLSALLTTSLLTVCIFMYQNKKWSIDKHYDIFIIYFGLFFYAVYWGIRDTFFVEVSQIYHVSEYIGSLLPLTVSFVFYAMRNISSKPIYLYLMTVLALALHIILVAIVDATDNELMFILAIFVSVIAYDKKHTFILPVLIGFIFYQGYISLYYYLIHDGTYLMQLVGMTPYIATLFYANFKIWIKLWKS